MTPAREATKDAGRVRNGGGAIHYADMTPARDATKDTGRAMPHRRRRHPLRGHDP